MSDVKFSRVSSTRVRTEAARFCRDIPEDPDYAPSLEEREQEDEEEEKPQSDEEGSSDEDGDDSKEARLRKIEELERERQAAHKRRHAEAVKANKAQWKIKKKEFASLTAKEKNTKRLSMKEAADVAKKRLKLQEDDDDSDDDGSDDDTNQTRSRNRLDNLDFLKQIGVEDAKQSLKRKRRLQQLEKQVVAPKAVVMTPLRPLSRRKTKTPVKFDAVAVYANPQRKPTNPSQKLDPWTRAWAKTKPFGLHTHVFSRLDELPHFVANVESYFGNFHGNKQFLKKAGSFLHLIMFGYDFFEGEEEEGQYGDDLDEDADEDDDKSPKASHSRYGRTRSTRNSPLAPKPVKKSISTPKRRLRSLFEAIGAFRGIWRGYVYQQKYRDGVWDALDFLTGRARHRKDDVFFYSKCAMLLAAPQDLDHHSVQQLCRSVQHGINALLEYIVSFFERGVTDRNCRLLMHDLMRGSVWADIYKVVDYRDSDDEEEQQPQQKQEKQQQKQKQQQENQQQQEKEQETKEERIEISDDSSGDDGENDDEDDDDYVDECGDCGCWLCRLKKAASKSSNDSKPDGVNNTSKKAPVNGTASASPRDAGSEEEGGEMFPIIPYFPIFADVRTPYVPPPPILPDEAGKAAIDAVVSDYAFWHEERQLHYARILDDLSKDPKDAGVSPLPVKDGIDNYKAPSTVKELLEKKRMEPAKAPGDEPDKAIHGDAAENENLKEEETAPGVGKNEGNEDGEEQQQQQKEHDDGKEQKVKAEPEIKEKLEMKEENEKEGHGVVAKDDQNAAAINEDEEVSVGAETTEVEAVAASAGAEDAEVDENPVGYSGSDADLFENSCGDEEAMVGGKPEENEEPMGEAGDQRDE